MMKMIKDNFFALLPVASVLMLIYLISRLIIQPSAQLFLGSIVAYTLRFNLLVIVVLGFLSYKAFISSFNKITLTTWLLLGVILAGGFYQFWVASPLTHRVYFDEDLYIVIAQNIAASNKALKTNLGTPTSCIEGEYNKDPSGMPAVVSIPFSLFGPSEYLASRVTVVISLLNVLLAFLLAYLLFKNQVIALFSGLIFILLPENIIWASTVAAEPYQLFFAGLTLLGLVLFKQTRNKYLLMFTLASLAYAAQVRIEGILLLVPVSLYLMVHFDLEKEKKSKFFVASFILFFLLILPQAFSQSAFKGENWGAGSLPMFGFIHFFHNFQTNFAFFFENTRTPLLVTLLAIVGFFPLREKIRTKLLLSSFFAVFFGIFLFFYAGSYNYGTDVRFSLILNLPLSIMAAVVCQKIRVFFLGRLPSLLAYTIIFACLFLSFLSVFNCIPLGEESIEGRYSHDYMVACLRALPKNSYHFSYDPCIAVINGQGGGQTFYLLQPDKMKKVFASAKHVYLFRDIWSHLPPFKDEWHRFYSSHKIKYITGSTFRNKAYNLYEIFENR
ncbi:MAG: glycosyltransferase family 39 protein [bacterium]